MSTRSARIAFAAVVLTLLASSADTASGRDDARDMKSFKKEDIVKTLKLADPAKAGEVVVDNVFGPITVEGYAGKDVVLEARKIVYARDEGRSRRAEEEVRLDLTEKANT